MRGLIQVVQSVGYVSGALPLLACLALSAKGRRTPLDGWLLAWAFAVSFLMDTVMLQLAHFGIPNWFVTYFGYPVQFGILLVAVTRARSLKTALLVLLVLVAVASGMRDTLDRPETFVRICAGTLVCGLIWGQAVFRPYRWALWLYCGVEIPFILLMGNIAPRDPNWLLVWMAYQGVRVTATCFLFHGLVRKEASHGTPHSTHRGRSPLDREYRLGLSARGGNGHLRDHRAPVVAQTAKG